MFRKSASTASNQPDQQQLSMLNLDRPVFEYTLPSFCYPKSLVAFAKTSTLFHHYSQTELQKIKLHKLLTHAIRGEQPQAEKLLKALPKKDLVVLLQKGKVTDYSNRKIEGTAFQLALGAEDVKFHENEECMAEMLARYIRMLPEGEAILAGQYQHQFPEGWEALDAVRAKQDSDALDQLLKVITEITEDDCQRMHDADDKIQECLRAEDPEGYDSTELKKINDAVLYASKDNFDSAFQALITYLVENKLIQTDTFYVDALALKALYQFRNHLESTTHQVIKSGKHFNAQLLAKAFSSYDENYAEFGHRWDSAKNIVCWRKVIGYIQRFMPACYAQAFSRGLYDVVENGQPLQRSLHFRCGRGSFFPLVSDSVVSMGYDYTVAAERAGRYGGVAIMSGGGSGAGLVPLFIKLMSSKSIFIAKFMEYPGNRQKSGCVVM